MVDAPEKKLKVLWATDGSGDAHSAIPLLKQFVLPAAERLQILTVAPHSFLSGARPDPTFLTKVTAGAKRRALLAGEETAENEATLLDPSVPVEMVARWGNPIEEVLKAAESMPADLIVVGAKGHSNLGLILLGSVAQGIVQNATRPVLVARPGARDVRRVIVGYDGSEPARRSIEFIEQLPYKLGIKFTLVEVMEPFAVPPGMPPGYRTQALEDAREINERNHETAERTLATVRQRLEANGLEVEAIVRTGNAATEIDALAREQEADLIMVGSRKPSTERHYLVGSTAEKLVRHAHTSVLVVR
jgi:nucleotide-binding universal stress UspA family protein